MIPWRLGTLRRVMSDRQLAIMMSPTILLRLVILHRRLRPTANRLSLASAASAVSLTDQWHWQPEALTVGRTAPSVC